MESVILIGAETVEKASVRMRQATEEMTRAANQIEGALQRHAISMERCTERLEVLTNTGEEGN